MLTLLVDSAYIIRFLLFKFEILRKLILFTFIVLASGFSIKTEPITQQERKSASDYLSETRDFFLTSVKNLSDAQLDFKAAPGKWSIRQCMEHIATSESGVWNWILEQLNQPADSSKRGEIKLTDEEVKLAIIDRSKKATAPEFLQPTGKFKTPAEAVKEFTDARRNLINYIGTTQDDLRNYCIFHPFFGMLDGYQWVLLMGGHGKRHTLQIEEVKAEPNFPKQ